MRFEVRVKPGSRRTAVGGAWGYRDSSGDRESGDKNSGDRLLVVAVTAPPVDGKANAAVVAALANAFGVPKRSVTIVRGETGRSKLVEIDGDESALSVRLNDLLG